MDVGVLSVFGGNFVLAKASMGLIMQCPLYGVEKCPLLENSKCIGSMGKSSDLFAVER